MIIGILALIVLIFVSVNLLYILATDDEIDLHEQEDEKNYSQNVLKEWTL